MAVQAFFDTQIYFQVLFADYPDPAHPGHLKGVTVSGPKLTFEVLVVVVLWLMAYRLRANRPGHVFRPRSVAD